ncbi:hypothetical protein FHL15_005713 [Xylaria flabelliformis]|uniref:Uncharacterized protein n=1 Tax=Xylaria flabelliformis TaxID=2512241 RepID=A0A553HZQ8_9PEZI|nr:hypothetical protein FHL15_005713 [Xylaria flabelliformis]
MAASGAKSLSSRDQQKPSRRANFTTWWWWWEIGAVILSFISNSLVLVLLLRVDGTAINNWSWPILPNSLLSVLTTISKTSLLVPVASCISQSKWRHFTLRPRSLNHLQIFDDASRGPWGSLVMVFNFIFEAKVWAIVSILLAISNIVALGIDASTQQIIGLVDKETTVPNNTVLVSHSQSYFSRIWDTEDFGQSDEVPQGFPGVKPYSEVERYRKSFTFQSLIYNAIAKTNLQSFYKCPPPATKCIWEDFSTLGVCAKYRNITNSTTQTCQLDRRACPTQNYSGTCGNCSFWSPDVSANDVVGGTPPIAFNWQVGSNLTLKHNEGDVFQNYLIGTYATLGSLWTVRVNNFTQSFNGSSYGLFESYILDFYWCYKEYHGVAASGQILNANSTTTTPWATYPDHRDDPESRLGVGTDHKFGIAYDYNLEGTPRLEISTSTLFYFKQTIRNLMGNKLRFSTVFGLLVEGNSQGAVSTNTSTAVSRFFWHNDPESSANDIADAMTAYMVEPGGDNIYAETLSGMMVYNETYYKVEWPWLAFLLLETLLVSILLILTILFTKGQPLLKSSVIGLLVYTIAGWREDELQVPGPESMEKWTRFSKGMTAQLGRDTRGLTRFYREFVKSKSDGQIKHR